MKIYHPETVFS